MAHALAFQRFRALRRRALAALALAACGVLGSGPAQAQGQAPQAPGGNADAAPAQAGPLKVVASFSILGDMVKQIGGGDVQVDVLVGPDGDAHEYEPTPADARRLAAAQLLVVNGLGFEAWLPKLVRASGFKGTTVVASDGVTPRDFGGDATGGHDHDHGAGNIDPHAWQSLANGVRYARNIGAALAAADPAHADAYRQRTEAYAGRIEALDARVKQAFAALPPERRRVVTSHDAFGYFGDAYGMTFISAMGVSTEAEPSAADVARIIGQIRQEKVPAVFLENVSSPKLAQQIARETGAHVGGTLYSDALAKSGLPASTYLGMFEWNLSQFMAALKP